MFLYVKVHKELKLVNFHIVKLPEGSGFNHGNSDLRYLSIEGSDSTKNEDLVSSPCGGSNPIRATPRIFHFTRIFHGINHPFWIPL